MHVGDLVGQDFIIGVGPDMSVAHAASRMAEEGVGCLVVLGDKGALVGIVTDRDLVVRVVGRGLDPADTPVSAAMTSNPVTVEAADEIEEAARAMREAGVRRLPVLDVDGKIVGVVSIDDIVAALGGELANIALLAGLVCRGARMGVRQ